MAAQAVAPGSGTLDQINFAAMPAEAQKGAEEGQNWPMIYPVEVYRQGGSMDGRVCKRLFDGTPQDKQACIGNTNATMAVLMAEVVGPLSQIPNLHKQLCARVWDPKVGEQITAVFESRMKFLDPPPDQALSMFVRLARDDMRTRTVNLMLSQFTSLTEDIAIFYQRGLSYSKSLAIATVVGCRNSVADTIACWTLYCTDKGLVNGDGTYNGRETRPEWLERNPALDAAAAVQPPARAPCPRQEGVDRGLIPAPLGATIKEEVLRTLPPEVAEQVRQAQARGKILIVSQEEYQRQLREGAKRAEGFCIAFSAAMKKFDEEQARKVTAQRK